MVFFKKWEPRQKVYLPDGGLLQFQDIGNGWGLLSTTDQYQINQLRECIKAQRGGVEEISQAEYEEVKKKPATNSFENNYREILDVKRMSILLRNLSEQENAAVGENEFSEKWPKPEFATTRNSNGFRPKAVDREAWMKAGMTGTAT